MYTITETRTMTKNHATSEPCPCGCAECEKICCRLDCLEQPRFFCGQLLTDHDMMALVRWTKAKLALSRYRHGWGVVCGLDVWHDPDHPGGVIVGPGYAISCCGYDIIVCEPTAKDLSTACPDLQENCYDPWGKPSEESKKDKPGVETDPWFKQFGEVTKVDLYLHYHEERSEPQTALARGRCQQVDECEYSRTRESFLLSWKPADDAGEVQTPRPRWPKEYENRVPVVSDFTEKWKKLPTDNEPIKRWLQNWLRQHPPRQFAFAQEWVEQFTPGKLPEILFWLAQDYRHSLLTCNCFSCEPDTGVPLARVWLQLDRSKNRQTCQVLAINPYPPFRRPLSHECWSAAPGCIHVGELIWQTPEHAGAILGQRGIRTGNDDTFIVPKTLTPKTLMELEDQLKKSQWPTVCSAEVVLQVMDTVFAGQRVIGVWASASKLSKETGV